jgi:CRISPR system Cascade subunit CasD
MIEYLVFQLYGPLAAWGEIAVGEERPVANRPGRSALLGLLAAALGIERVDEQAHKKLADGYGLAVCVDNPGLPILDFHTVQSPPRVALKNLPHATRRDEIFALENYNRKNSKSVGTLVSRRSYRQDGFWRVAVWETQNAPFSLNKLRHALCFPAFCLYLGRKACPPAIPLAPRIVKAENPAEAIDKADHINEADYVTDGALKRKVLSGKTVPQMLYWDAEIPGAGNISPQETLTRHDAPLSRERRQFGVRYEHRAPWPESKEEN